MSKAYCSCRVRDTDSTLEMNVWACCATCAKRKKAVWMDRSARGMSLTNIPHNDAVWQMRLGLDIWYLTGAWNEVTPEEVDELNRDAAGRGHILYGHIEPNQMRGKLR